MRKIIWGEDACVVCGRGPYTRRDGRAYLYCYREDGPTVCSPRCDKKWLERKYDERFGGDDKPFVFNEAGMFPFVQDRRRMTD